MSTESTMNMTPADPDRELIMETVEKAALGTKGVSRMIPRLTETITESISWPGAKSRGIRLSESGRNLTADLYLSVIYGYNIPQVSWDAQTRVREACMSRCGVHLKEINIHVQGVDMPGETEASEGEQEERIEKHEQN